MFFQLLRHFVLPLLYDLVMLRGTAGKKGELSSLWFSIFCRERKLSNLLPSVTKIKWCARFGEFGEEYYLCIRIFIQLFV